MKCDSDGNWQVVVSSEEDISPEESSWYVKCFGVVACTVEYITNTRIYSFKPRFVCLTVRLTQFIIFNTSNVLILGVSKPSYRNNKVECLRLQLL